MTGYAFSDFKDINEIKIPADADAVNRGYGAFDFFSVINNLPFYLERHLDRFFNTMQLMRLSIPESRKKLTSIIHEVVQKNAVSDFHIKLFAYPKNAFDGEKTIGCNLFVLPVIVPPTKMFDISNGVKVITKDYQRFLPEAKSTNYLPVVYWYNEILSAGAVDVLYYSDGYVRESSRGNVFIYKDGRLSTPNEKMLKGITRSIAMDALKANDISFFEEPVSIDTLLNADEVFLTSTTKKILPVVKIDDCVIGDGKPGKYADILNVEFEAIRKNWNK